MYRVSGKRLLDLALVIPALVMLMPVMLGVALLVRWKLGAPVLFRQWRPGRGEVPFEMWKFRTMSDGCDAAGRELEDDMRLGAFGAWLRRSSLDELPELVNVLRGEMSLVGPRPLLMKYLDRYTAEQRRRHEVAPGVTGWAQVHGRNALSWETKFALDLYYVEHCSLLLDALILWRTIGAVFGRRGVTAPDSVSGLEFMGSGPEGQVGKRDGAGGGG